MQKQNKIVDKAKDYGTGPNWQGSGTEIGKVNEISKSSNKIVDYTKVYGTAPK